MLGAVVVGVVAVYPSLLAPELRRGLLPVAAFAVAAVVVAAIGRWGALIQAALSLVLAAYAVALLETAEVDRGAPFVAAGLIVGAEVAYASLEPPTTRRAVLRTALLITVAAAAAAVLGAFLIGTAGVGEGSLVEYGVGIAAAATAVGVLAWLTWRRRAGA